MAHIDDALVGREQREDNYRRWSERAVVVGYNSENQSYDIVVTTERLVGANKRTLNKTIRRVKSILDATVRVFLPGEAVTIGYLSDKREHPVILGLGDNVVQTPSKVTLGPTLNIEGVTSIELEPEPESRFVPTPCFGDLVDSITGSTTTLTVDCETLDIFGCFEVNVEAPTGCGCGVYDWSLSGPIAGFTISDQGELASAIGLTITLSPFGPGNSKLKICPPISVNNFGTDHAYARFGQKVDTFCTAEFCHNSRDCADRDIHGVICSVFSGSQHKGTCLTGGPTPSCCDGSGAECIGGQACKPIQLKTIVAVDDALLLACVNTGPVCDLRTASMLSQGCFPCGLAMNDAIITATDACGKIISIAVEIDL